MPRLKTKEKRTANAPNEGSERTIARPVSAVKAIAHGLDSLPDAVSREVPLPAGAMTVLRAIVDRIRSQMYNDLTCGDNVERS